MQGHRDVIKALPSVIIISRSEEAILTCSHDETWCRLLGQDGVCTSAGIIHVQPLSQVK